MPKRRGAWIGCYLHRDDSLLRIIPCVLRQGLGDAEEGLSEGLDAQLYTALRLLPGHCEEVLACADLQRKGADPASDSADIQKQQGLGSKSHFHRSCERAEAEQGEAGKGGLCAPRRRQRRE